jgi:hypothetical protein
MMHGAVKIAIDLLHFPSQTRYIRSAPLPDDVVVLLRIVSADEEVTRQVAQNAGRSLETVREAAAFYILQILLFPEADSYRVLGAKPEATNGELRHNMALLLRWLHPDLDRKRERSAFAARVTRAWNDLKTPERRARYDRLQRRSVVDKSLSRKKARLSAQANGQFRRNRAHFAGHMPFPQVRYVKAHKRIGLLRRVMLLLLVGRRCDGRERST